ncbi:xanthine dehydrogenase accessory protein XdhC [Microvirga flavescens]|uniref:xanthine dehydrogenase accessory protein XdhC n=1 Tax=Microvirga flavescens TaxID=2249811 RepID=UPI000DD9BECB|nr:xanthine dehydrogenase accessory protein XdhC [Microvirga flavescens]
MRVWQRLAEIVAEHGAAALVSVHEVKGSTPREVGARMIVRADGAFSGSVGGGQLEWRMMAVAQAMLTEGRPVAKTVDQALGPALGQCCGGVVKMLVEVFDRGDLETLRALSVVEREGVFETECFFAQGRVVRKITRQESGAAAEGVWRETHGEARIPLLLFGAGHVARALVLALAPLPFSVRWIDNREDAFPSRMPENCTAILSEDPTAEIDAAPDDAFVLVMTHDHALDLAITASALRRPFPYVGLIGSETKRARFERHFRDIGTAPERIRSLICPVGIAGIRGKEPAIIAASVTAQLLQVAEQGRN